MNSRKLTRRDFLRNAGFVAGAACIGTAALPFFSDGRAFGMPGRVRIGVIAPSHCALSLVHASLTARYKKNGIDAEIVYMPDALDIAKGLAKGDIQVGQLMSPIFYAMNAGSGPFKNASTALVTAQVGGTNGGVLVVDKVSEIKTPKDLAGQKIAVHSQLMIHSLLINMLLKKNGIDPVKDVTSKTIHMGGIIPAMRKDEINVFINPEPLGTSAISQGVGRELMLTKSLWFRHPCCLISVKKDFFKKEPDAVKAIYLSSMESGLQLNSPDSRTEAIERIQKDAKPFNQMSKEVLTKAFTPGRSDFDPFPFQSSGKAVIAMMKEFKLMPPAVDADKMVSETVLSDLARELLKKLGDTPPASNSRQEKIVGDVMG